jgi:hypothetical protein
MRSKKIFIVFCLSLLLFVSFSHIVKAAGSVNNGGATGDNDYYEVDGDNETKDETFILPGPTGQTYKVHAYARLSANDPGEISASACIVRPDGLVVACQDVIDAGYPSGNNQYISGSDDLEMDLNWVGGSWVLIHIRVDSSSKYITRTYVTAYGRYVDAGTLSASPGTVNQGQKTTLRFNPINNISNIYIFDLTHGRFDWQELPDTTSAETWPINEDTIFSIMVKGPCPDGSAGECVSGSNTVTVHVAKATVACVVHRSTINGPPISGATCSIAGQSGTTNGDGYRAFNNIGLGNQTLTVTANGYNSYSGTKNITGNYDWHVALTPTYYSCSGSSTQGCTSGANACGQTSSGTRSRTCDTTNGEWSSWSSCSASPPATPAPVACTGATSSPNSCGDTNPGGAGTIQCYGTSRQSACSGATGSTPAQRPNYGAACSAVASAPNICGMIDYGTNGTYVCNGGANSGGGTRCTAVNGVTPANNLCPAPSVSITANGSGGPVTVPWNSNVTIAWSSANSSSCAVTPTGWTDTSGSQATGNLSIPSTYVYTISCTGTYWSSASDSVTVVVSAPPPTTSSVTITEPNYCASGPAVTMSWGYSDLAGSPQSAYQVQLDDQGSFNSINVDSGKILSSSNAWYSGQGVLAFNIVYHARVRTWSGYDVVSSWQEATICSGPGCTGGGANSWKTPVYAYPQTDFNWTANGILNNPSPPLNKPVQFTDTTVFGGNPNGRQWSWVLGEGATSTTQNPSHTYSAEGSYYVTLTATDNANQVCIRTKGPLIIQKPIPKWREIAPK